MSALDETRPRLRGVLHQWAFVCSLGTGLAIIGLARTPRAFVAAAVYAATMSGLFGVSALYHRGTWTAAGDRWMRRLDHSMIFLLIAGTFTPMCALSVEGTLGTTLLAVVWGGALAGIVLKVAWIDGPRWLTVAIALALGWAGLAALPALASRAGWTPTSLILLGGLLYSAGALVYARRRPDPVPSVFGYHEVFHAFVILAAGIQYAAVAGWVIPAAV